MYAIALRRIEPSKNMARFYAVEVMPTLFGQWAVVRRWGRVNTDGRRSETWFDDLAVALNSAAEHAGGKYKRGYATVKTWEAQLDSSAVMAARASDRDLICSLIKMF